MHAMVLKRFGAPDVLEPGEAALPGYRANQMQVRVAACGVCGHDLLNRAGHFSGTRLPAVLGHEIAGVVEEVGSLIKRFKPGDRVALLQRQPCGQCRSCKEGRENLCRLGDGFYGEEISGGYGEFVTASELNAVLLPAEIPFGHGAVLCCALGTGYHALQRSRVRAGDPVVITGASGGVGIHTVQIARLMGLYAIAVTSSSAKQADLRAAGADEIVVAADGNFHDRVRGLTAGEGAAAVIEIAGTSTFNSSARALRAGGRVVFVGNVHPGNVAVNPAVSILKETEFIGSAHATMADLVQIVDLVRRGRLAPVIAATLPVDQAAQAHLMLEQRAAIGRVVLTHG